MIQSNAFNYINVLDKAADASWTRNELIQNNIANISTPGYKRKDLRFESFLAAELAGPESLDVRIANVDMPSLYGEQYTDHAGLNYRMDENNVDVDAENSYLAQNQIRYNALIDSVSHEFSRIKTVLMSS